MTTVRGLMDRQAKNAEAVERLPRVQHEVTEEGTTERPCDNAAALRSIPDASLDSEGYGRCKRFFVDMNRVSEGTR
jgi:hypothetical protein